MARIAILQMTSGIDPATNGRTVADAISAAADAGAAMLFAPEMAGLLDKDRRRAAQHIGPMESSAYLAAVRAAAAKHKIWVHAGSLPVADLPAGDTAMNDATPPKWRNRSVVIDSDGAVRASYDKIHLFDITLSSGEQWRESAAYAPGGEVATVATPVGALGLTICYDLRFPPLFAALADAGASIICVPAAFTVPTGEAHWHMLLRARAVDNGCFIVAAAQSGLHEDGRTTYGHSLVVDPWGQLLHDAGTEPGLSLVDIDLHAIAEIRARLPLRAHRRPIGDVRHYSL